MHVFNLQICRKPQMIDGGKSQTFRKKGRGRIARCEIYLNKVHVGNLFENVIYKV